MPVKAATTALLLALTAYGQSIVTPLFVHKDGEASPTGYAGSHKEILVDGSVQQVTGWMTFQTRAIDVSAVGSANLALCVHSLETPGTLDIYALTSDIDAPENNLPLTSLPMAETPVASVALGSGDVERVLRIDITGLMSPGPFYGVALVSDDGLVATFDAKEGDLPPLVLLDHDLSEAAAAWHSDAGAPGTTLGTNGDYYLDTDTGDLYAKEEGVWSLKTNIAGPRGEKGDTGEQGPQGEPGPAGTFPGGSIAGTVSICDEQDHSGVSVFVPGHSFMAKTAQSGAYQLHHLPAGTYSVVAELAGNASATLQDITVVDGQRTDVAAIPLCPDADHDGYDRSVDCDDSDSLVNPGAAEICHNGKDDNCSDGADENCGVQLDVIPFCQCDPLWANTPMGTGGETICGIGTLLTALTMLLSVDDPTVTPQTLHDWLDANGGITAEGLIMLGVVNGYPGSTFAYQGKSSDITPTALRDALDNGYPVIARLTSEYILIYGYVNDGTSMTDFQYYATGATCATAHMLDASTGIVELVLYAK